jgi:succinyl-diaminopimelate desuccinylase
VPTPETDDRALTSELIAQRVAAFIDSRRNALLEDTASLLRFRTVSGGTPEQEREFRRELPRCFEWLEGVARRMGFEFRVLDGIVAEICWPHPDPEAPVLVVATHIDVVTPVGNWTHPPFAAEIAGGDMYARGIQDDKGPLVQVLYGLWALKSIGVALPCEVHVAIGTMEETSLWDDIELYVRETRRPAYAFTPDANFPIINGEKGIISLLFDAQWGADPVDAATGLEFVRLNGGERENIVPSACELTLRFPEAARNDVMKELVRSTTEFVVEHSGANVTLVPARDRKVSEGRHESVVSFIGRGAHSSTPERGHNAILDAVAFIGPIETLPEPVRRFATFMRLASEDTSGANLDLAGTHPFIGPTTVNLSLLDIEPGRGRALLNIRPTMGTTCDEVVEKCRIAADSFAEATGMRISVSVKGMSRDAIFLDPEDPAVAPFLRSLQRGFELVTGRPCELRSTAGTTYAKAIPNCCAFGPILSPDEPELAHQADERFPVEGIIRNAKIYGTSIGLLAVPPTA